MRRVQAPCHLENFQQSLCSITKVSCIVTSFTAAKFSDLFFIRRRTGVYVGLLPADLVLIAAFRKPAFPQAIVPDLESLCSLLRV